MFLWRADVILDELRKYLPDVHAALVLAAGRVAGLPAPRSRPPPHRPQRENEDED